MSELEELKARAEGRRQSSDPKFHEYQQGAAVVDWWMQAEADLDRALVIAECDICGGNRHPSGLECVCKGTNQAQVASMTLREMLFDARKELEQARADVLALRDAIGVMSSIGNTVEQNAQREQILADTESYEAYR